MSQSHSHSTKPGEPMCQAVDIPAIVPISNVPRRAPVPAIVPISTQSRRPSPGKAPKANAVLTTALSNAKILPEDKQALYLQIDLKGPKQVKKATRLPVDIALVIDCSGSMGFGVGSARDQAFKAATFLLKSLSGRDRSALVLYDDKVVVAKELDQDHQKAIEKLQNVALGGSTALADALYKGIEQIGRADSKRSQWVFMLSDGQANVGDTEPDIIANRVAEGYRRGVHVSSFGLGAYYNEDLMEALAHSGGGGYHYLATPDDAPAAFQAELTDLMAITARGARLALTPAAGVTVRRLLGLDAESFPVEVGDIPAGALRTLLVELEVSPDVEGRLDLARVDATWREATGKAKKSEQASVTTHVTDDEDEVSRAVDADVLGKLAEMEAALAQAQAAVYASSGDYDQARQVISLSRGRLQTVMAMSLSAPVRTSVSGKCDELVSSLGYLNDDDWDQTTAKTLKSNSYSTRSSRPNYKQRGK